jgi:superfamily II DNA or RNA helicase
VEILQLVRVRGAHWRITDVRSYDACRLVTAVAAGGASRRLVRRFVLPFEDVVPVAATARARRVGLPRWRRACRALIASDRRPDSLTSAAGARMDLMPHQLEPALAVVRGDGTRVMLADEVGLGKTVQAGLILAELLARHAVERALILTPAGLRPQWHDELASRFAIDAAHADASAFRERCAGLPIGENPWATAPVAIASLDYVKRAEVLPAAAACTWDIVIVDEAHTAVGDSDRCAAIRALASRAPYVILLTATPHNGDDRAFATICGIGSVSARAASFGVTAQTDDEPPLLVFRRTREAIRAGAIRRVHTLRIRPSPAERRMHDALARFRRAVRDEHGARALALSVLDKRAFSSAWALAQSVDRRLQTLAGQTPDAWEQQLALPLAGADGDVDTADTAPLWPEGLSLSDADRERDLLAIVARAAHAAVRDAESKIDALRRVLERTGESAIVFTEYRDTAEHVRAAIGTPLLLHGGLSRAARTAVIQAFLRDARAVLVATDAAGQGLNLHQHCRLVVNLELPWNPMRLEQRIGRVDRIGQRRPVHAVHLVAAGTREERILSRLRRRVAVARRAIGAPDPLTSPSRSARGWQQRPPLLAVEAAAEAGRAAFVRLFLDDAAGAGAEVMGNLQTTRWWIARARRPRLRSALGGGSIHLWRLVVENEAGRTIASRLVPLLVHDRARPIDALPPRLLDEWRGDVEAAHRRFWQTRIARERRIAELASAARPALFQPVLFHRRAERAQAQLAADWQRFQDASAARLAHAIRQASVDRAAGDLLLVLLPR